VDNSFPYWQFIVERWTGGKISFFDFPEQGLFLHLCNVAWINGGGIEVCEGLLQQKFNTCSTHVQHVLKSFVDCGILLDHGDHYRIKFIDEQLAELGTLREKRSKAGKASAQKRQHMFNTCSTGVQQGKVRESRGKGEKKPDPPPKPPGESALSPEFLLFWEQVPAKKAKADAWKAWQKAVKRATVDEIMAGLPVFQSEEKRRSAQSDYRPLHPATWLNADRWTDEATPASTGSHQVLALAPDQREHLAARARGEIPKRY